MRRVAVAAVTAAAAYAAPAWTGAPAVGFPGVLRRVHGARDRVALTFDDGPHDEGTRAVLAALAAAGLRATFFVVGEQVRRRPELVAELVAGGHEVALHGDRHVPHALRPPAAVRDDLARGLAAAEDAAGAPVRFVRAPYGAASLATLAFARRRGLTPVAWSRWGRDWTARATPASVARRVAGRARSGDVLLLHDGDAYAAPGAWRATAGAVPLVAARLAAAGLAAVPLGEAVAAAPFSG